MFVHRFIVSDYNNLVYKSILPETYPTARNCIECFNKYIFIGLYKSYFFSLNKTKNDCFIDCPNKYKNDDYLFIYLKNISIKFTPYMNDEKVIKVI